MIDIMCTLKKLAKINMDQRPLYEEEKIIRDAYICVAIDIVKNSDDIKEVKELMSVIRDCLL